MTARAILFVFAVVVLTGNSRADEKLNGSEMKAEDAIATSDAVFIGKVTSIGAPNQKGEGPLYYPTGISIVETYKGSIVTDPISWDMRPPSLGKDYIFFVKKNEGRELLPVKLLSATDANIAEVKKLIAQANSG